MSVAPLAQSLSLSPDGLTVCICNSGNCVDELAWTFLVEEEGGLGKKEGWPSVA